jgi:putative pyruvate formate lyase activating enzyme
VNTATTPSIIELHNSGELARRAAEAAALRDEGGCHLCPGKCRAERADDQKGNCGIGKVAVLSSVAPHFGEEPCLVGQGGSGTLFFSGCNLNCIFCQNHEISKQPDAWREVGAHELASFMLSLQARGAENINLVTPSHIIPDILAALVLAMEAGLSLPIVYNSSGYDLPEALALLDGVIDIYMPDFKFSDPASAAFCTSKPDYPDVARAAIREMHRQVGDLVLDSRGVAVRGLLVRHLVLPGGHAGTAEVMRFLSEEISADTVVNVMDQYFPAHEAHRHPPFDRRISREEYLEARQLATDAGLRMVEDLP